ncbi:MAG: Ig-like domain repeat protein [Flexilinea sp.]|nr:Ig-like domain repeat protein [Flexilinea sp.]
MDGQGYSREVAFSQSVINIGADNGNDIVLRGSSVADFHALMHYDSGHWSLSSLNGAYRTSVNGLAMGAEGTVLQNGSIVEIGPYRLTMMLNGINTDIIIQSPAEAGSSPDEDSIGTNENIQLEITRMDQTELDAGAAAEIELTVTNAGPLVANMQLQLQGIPSAWVQIIPPVLNLNEGRKGTFLVRISPPRNSSAAAGLYSIHFVAISPNYPRNTGVADTTLTILPYSEFLLSGPTPLQLKLSRGKQTDIADFVVINNSNAVGAYFVQSRDDSNELNFAYQKTGSGAVAAGQEMITVQAGDRARIPMEITAKKVPLLGMTSKHHHYYTEVTPSDRPGETQTIAGEVVVKPTIHTMVLLLLLALLVLSVAVIFQPYIHTFDLQDGRNSQVIVAGSSTHLRWNVSRFASTITLNNGQADSGVSRGGSEYVNPTSSVTYTLTAENFLSKLLNITHKKTVQVLVVPMRPAIDVFSVDKSRALFDESVTLNWSVEPNATSATITTNKAANQLTAENYTGKLSQGYQTDSLISLKAQNDSGYDVKSLFVNVAEDSITLNKFVVWVRPNGIAVPENNDVRRNTRWGSLQVTGGTANRGTGVNPQPAAQSNTLEIPDNFNTVGYGTQNLNPEVMAVSGQAMPSGSYSYQPPAGSGSPSTELLVSPALNPTATPIPTVDAPSLAADNVIVRATAAPSTSPEGTSSNRDFTIKLAEVIEDPLADSGYRVISYYPDYVLQKQEQILVEWNVDGVSKVKIENLSGDDLTNNGGEYSYPEKSTTYTLTAQVGETKKVYSLPVNVAGEADNGEGSGLNCELKANATTLKVPGTVMLTWSGGGTNRVQLVSSTQAEKENDEAEKKKEEEAKAAGQSYTKPTPGPLSGGTIGDYLQPSGFMRVNVDKQTTFMLNAYDASNNVICTKSVEVKYEGGVDKKDVTLAITRIADSNNVVRGVYTLGQTVFYTVALSGYEKGKDPSGNVMLTDGVTTCSMTLPVTTCSFQAKKLGDLTITAVYAGDDTYNKATATAKERVVEKLPTSIQINSAIKPTSDTADVEVELLWDHNHSYGFVPGGIVTLTAGSSSCDINIDDKSMTCAGEVNVVKVATAEDENQKENKEKGYTAGSVYISVKNLGLKDLTADRVTAVYKGDDYFKTSTSQSVLFMKIPTTIEISEAYKPDKDHANVKTLLSWDENKTGGRLPTGTLKYTVGNGSCTLEIETGKLSCEPKTGTVSKDHHNYTISNMLLEQNGADRISVEYSGDSLFNASTSTQVLFATIPTELEISEAEKTSDGGLNATITLSWDKTAPEGMTPGKTIKLTLSSDNSGKNKSASVTTESTGVNSVSDSTTNTDTTETETTGASCTLLITGDEPKFTDCKGEVSVKTTEDKKRIYEIKNLDMGSSKGDTLKAEYSGDGTFISSTSLPVFFNIIDTELTLSNAVKSSDNRISLTAKLTPDEEDPQGRKTTGTIVFTSGAATCTLDISDPEKLKFDGCTGNVSVDSDGNYTITNMVMKGTPGASISAEYSGDGVYGKSTSPTVTFNNIITETTITDASKTKVTTGGAEKDAANLTVTLSWVDSVAEGKKPTGTITLTAGSGTCELNVETAKLSGCDGTVTKSGYKFVITNMILSDSQAGTVKAKYNGDSQFLASESQEISFNKVDTSISIESLAKISEELANLEAILDWDQSIAAQEPTGTLTFIAADSTEEKKSCVYDIESKAFTTCTELDGSSVDPYNTFTFIVNNMPLGDASVDRMTVKYSGDDVFNPSTSTMKLFEKIPTELVLKDVSKPGSLSANATADLTWSGANSGGAMPTGTITFTIGTGGETCVYTMGSGNFTCLEEGQTVISVTEKPDGEFILAVTKMLLKTTGADRISAKYSGDSLFMESSTNYYGFDKIDPNLTILKVTDDEGKTHEWYKPEQDVRVYIDMPGEVAGTAPTGPVTVTIDSATCTITYPQNFCSLKLSKVKSDAMTVTATYAGDDFYLSGKATLDPPIKVRDPQPLKVEITKITDENGNEQKEAGEYVYAINEPVIVSVFLSDFDETEQPTGDIKVNIGSSSCTISWPNASSCKLTTPSEKKTYEAIAEYQGNGYYDKTSSDPVKVNITGLKINLEITSITNTNQDSHGDYIEQPYYVYDPKGGDEHKGKGQTIRVCTYLSDYDTTQTPTNQITLYDLEHDKDKTDQLESYDAPGTCKTFDVRKFTGEITLTALYSGDNNYVSKTATKTMIVQNKLEPEMYFLAYRTVPYFSNKGSILFMFDYDTSLPDQYDVSPFVDGSDPVHPEQSISFKIGTDWKCTYNLGNVKNVTEEGITVDLTSGCGDGATIKVYKDYGIFEIENVTFPESTEDITGSYDGNTYFYDETETDKVYQEDQGYTRIDLSDALRINNEKDNNAHAFLTAALSYNQSIKDESGNKQKPAGKLVVKNGESSIAECPFDLDEMTFSNCGTVAESGDRFIFTFENLQITSSVDKVIVQFVANTGGYFQDSNKATSDEFKNESAPVIELQDALKLNANQADFQIIVRGVGTLTKKYNVYPYVRISSKVEKDGEDTRTCLFNMNEKKFEGSGCFLSGYSEDGDAFTLKGVRGTDFIYQEDRWATVILETKNFANLSSHLFENPVDTTAYYGVKIPTSIVLSDVLKYNDRHAFLTFALTYENVENPPFGDAPNGWITISQNNTDGSNPSRCYIQFGTELVPDQGCNEDMEISVNIDQTTGVSYYSIQGLDSWADQTKVTVSYGADDNYSDSSAESAFTSEYPQAVIQNVVHKDGLAYSVFELKNMGSLSEKYELNNAIRFTSYGSGDPKSCDYNLSSGTISASCQLGSLTKNGDTYTLKGLNGGFKSDDTHFSVSVLSDKYPSETVFSRDKEPYGKINTSLRILRENDGFFPMRILDAHVFLKAELTYTDYYGIIPSGKMVFSTDGNNNNHTWSCEADAASTGVCTPKKGDGYGGTASVSVTTGSAGMTTYIANNLSMDKTWLNNGSGTRVDAAYSGDEVYSNSSAGQMATYITPNYYNVSAYKYQNGARIDGTFQVAVLDHTQKYNFFNKITVRVSDNQEWGKGNTISSYADLSSGEIPQKFTVTNGGYTGTVNVSTTYQYHTFQLTNWHYRYSSSGFSSIYRYFWVALESPYLETPWNYHVALGTQSSSSAASVSMSLSLGN